MKLTQATVAALTSERDMVFWDDQQPCFGVRVRPTGAKAYVVQFRVDGRSQKHTLGSTDKLVADQARIAAKKVLGAAALGTDPGAEKKAARASAQLTFGSLIPRYLDAKAGELRPGTLKAVTRHLLHHWRGLHSRPVHTIERRDIAAVRGRIATERGATAANRAKTSISSFFSWCMSEGLVDTNPSIGVRVIGGETARDRVLSDAEICSIWVACGDNDFGRIVRLLLLTGQRRSEIGDLLWREVDLENRKLTIAGARTKNGRPSIVPLSNLAISILEPLKSEGRHRVFGRDGASSVAWQNPKLALDARVERMTGARLEPWKLHDLRRSAATILAKLATPPHVVERLLNHASGQIQGVSAVYNRYDYGSETRRAVELLAAHIEAILEGRPASNVIAIGRG
jgi:integrase